MVRYQYVFGLRQHHNVCIYLPGRVCSQRTVLLYSTTAEQIVRVFGRLLSSEKKPVLLINYYLGGWYRNRLGLLYLSNYSQLIYKGCVRLSSLSRPRSAPVHPNSYDGAHLGQPQVPCLWSGSLGGDLRCMPSPQEGECDRSISSCQGLTE